MESGNPLAYVGIGALIISTLLTTLYLGSILIKAYFPRKELDIKTLNKDVKDPNLLMTLPLIGLAAVSIGIGVYPSPIFDVFVRLQRGYFKLGLIVRRWFFWKARMYCC